MPYERKGASAVLFHQYVAALRDAGYDILHLLLLERSNSPPGDFEEYATRMSASGRVQVIAASAERFVERARNGFALNDAPLESALAEARHFGPDAFFALDLMSYWAGTSVPALARVAWLGDLNFQTTWYHALCRAKEEPLTVFRLPSAWRRARQWERVYQSVLREADQVIASSASSVAILNRLGIRSVYHPYPWPVIRSAAKDADEVQAPAKPAFLFCGGLDALGSKSALLFIIRQLYPRLVKRWGRDGFRLIIAGRGQPPSWVFAAIKQRPEIEFKGFVEDLDAEMAQCHAMIVPIDVPVGNRSRIVTAMSNGWLVVGHRFVAEANPDLVDGRTCYLAADADEFAAKMQRACLELEEVRRIKAAARQRYEERFLPTAACRPLLVELERLLKLKIAG